METELSEPIQLTPMLSLAIALLYMMTADGVIEEHESSQLQAVVGGNEDALDLAMEYVETVPLEQFLREAPEQLNAEDRLCILCNVCDSIMADGVVESAELVLFNQLSEAFGLSSQNFSPYYKAIEFKNNKRLLGVYDPEKLSDVIMPPHLAMAASIVYMMSVDGNIAKEEIGQLKLMIGEFEGLQSAAMQYVRNFKMSQFLKETSPYLSEQQKLLILTIILDTLQADGQIDEAELRLFETIQKAFGVTAEVFQPLEHAMTTKNMKPFGLDVIDPKSMHKRRSKRKPHADGGIFSIKKGKKSSDEVEERHYNDQTGEWEQAQSDTHAGNIVHRTLDSNIKDVTEEFKDKADVDLMASNANEKERRLKVAQDRDKANIQNLDESNVKANIQNLDESNVKANIQGIGVDAFNDNHQGIPIDQLNDQMAEPDADMRMDSLQDDINQVHQKLDQVKPTKKWKRLDTLFSRKDKKQKNKDQLQNDASIDNIADIEAGSLKDNKQPLGSAAVNVNKQPAGSDAVNDNIQGLGSAGLKDNKQPLESAAVNDNIQGLGSAGLKDNKQPLESAAVNDNIQGVASASVQDTSVLVSAASTSLGDILHRRLAQPENSESSAHLSAASGHRQEVMTEPMETQEGSDLSAMTSLEDDAAMAQTTSLAEEDDGGIRLRTLMLVIAISVPLVVFAYGLIYPTMVCQGQSHQWQTFSPDSELSTSKIMEDQQVFERHLVQIRRGEFNINNQRFPLYKELNPSDHFAQQTKDGFKGSYSNHVVDRMKYLFDFNKSTGELNIETKSNGVRYFEGQSGRVEVFSSFKGQCENRWF